MLEDTSMASTPLPGAPVDSWHRREEPWRAGHEVGEDKLEARLVEAREDPERLRAPAQLLPVTWRGQQGQCVT